MNPFNLSITILLLAAFAPALTGTGFASETRDYKKAGARELHLHIEKPSSWKSIDQRSSPGWLTGEPALAMPVVNPSGESGTAKTKADEGRLVPFTPAADLKGKWNFTADPKLPNVLIIGDSISIGYTRAVRARLAGKANVWRPIRGNGPENCGDTVIGLAKIDGWLGKQKWDVIHFNWGLWDLCYRDPAINHGRNADKVGGKISVTPEGYEKNLEKLVIRMQATGAKLVWANTTHVPDGEAGRFVGDDQKYNAVAARVMEKHGIPTNDLNSLTKGFPGKFFPKPGDVHYTGEGYQKIAAQVATEIEKLLP